MKWERSVTRSSRDTLLTIGYTLAGLAGALLAARLALGPGMFQTRQFAGFPVIGFAAALVYASAQLRGLGTVMVILLLLYLSQIALNPPIRTSSVVSAAVFTVPVGSALVGSSIVFRVLRRVPVGRFIIMGLIVALGYGAMVALFLVLMRQPLATFLVLDQAVIGLKLGACLGLGFELVDLVARLFRDRASETPAS